MIQAAEVYFKRQQYLRFKNSIQNEVESRKVKEINEVKVLNHLAQRLQKKGFYCLKIYNKHSKYIERLMKQSGQLQQRRWFDMWREKFLNKNHYNYLCHVQRSLTKTKRSASVKFNVNNSAKHAASPVVEIENFPYRYIPSKSPSPVKRPGIMRQSEVFKQLTFDNQR